MRASIFVSLSLIAANHCFGQDNHVPLPEGYVAQIPPLLKGKSSFSGSTNLDIIPWNEHVTYGYSEQIAYGYSDHFGILGQVSLGYNPDSTIRGHHIDIGIGTGLFGISKGNIPTELSIIIGGGGASYVQNSVHNAGALLEFETVSSTRIQHSITFWHTALQGDIGFNRKNASFVLIGGAVFYHVRHSLDELDPNPNINFDTSSYLETDTVKSRNTLYGLFGVEVRAGTEHFKLRAGLTVLFTLSNDANTTSSEAPKQATASASLGLVFTF